MKMIPSVKKQMIRELSEKKIRNEKKIQEMKSKNMEKIKIVEFYYQLDYEENQFWDLQFMSKLQMVYFYNQICKFIINLHFNFFIKLILN